MLGMTTTVVPHVSSPEDPAAKSERCRDEEILANLVFTNFQVGGATCDVDHTHHNQGVLFVETEWKVQRVHATNPLQVKKKATTTSKSSAAFTKEFLTGIKDGDTTLTGSCDVGTTTTNTRIWRVASESWINEQEISILLLVSVLEHAGYIVPSHTKKD